MIAPTQIGIPNKIFNAIEDPITSYILVLMQLKNTYISEPIIAISVINHKIILVLVGNYSLHNLARFL